MQPELQPVNSQIARPGELSIQQNRVLRNTYLLLAVTLIPTVIGAVIGTNSGLGGLMRQAGWMSFIVIMVVFYGWIWAIEKNRDSGIGVALLLGFTFFLGLLLGPLLSRVLGFSNGGQLVAMAVGGTAVTFFGLAAVASTTKRDFTKMGSFLTIGAIVIMLAVVGQLFFQSPVLQLVIISAFIIFSAMMILYQINSMVHGGESNYVSCTLSLYISIYNLFSSLLQLLGIFGGDKD